MDLRPVATTALRAARAVAVQTAALIVPIVCPCGREGSVVCEECAPVLSGPAIRVDPVCSALQVLVRADAARGAEGVEFEALFPVLALGEHGGSLRRLVLAWKNGGMLCLGPRFADALAPGLGRLVDPRAVVLVPIPSSIGHRLRRGEDHTAELARALARQTDAEVLDLLRLGGGSQIGRSGRARREARRGRLRVISRWRGPCRAVLVDDVVTTGSTLRAARDALAEQGVHVCGAVVVASARVPRSVLVPASGLAGAAM